MTIQKFMKLKNGTKVFITGHPYGLPWHRIGTVVKRFPSHAYVKIGRDNEATLTYKEIETIPDILKLLFHL